MAANSVVGSMYGRAAGSVYSDASMGSLGAQLYAAELQQQRSMRMMQNIGRQAEAEADRQLHYAEKQASREDQLAAFAAQQEEQHRQRVADAAVREQQRRERAEMAALQEQQMREHAHHKVMAGDHRADQLAARREEVAQQNREHAAQVAAQREAAYQASVEQAEARRAHLMARQEAAERLAKERDDVKALERSIQEERAFLKQEARNAAKERAEAELQQRTEHYQRKGHAKEAAIESWQHSTNAVRRLKAEEARERAEYIAMQAKMAAEADAAKRAQYRSIAMSKAHRVDSILAEREALADKMVRLRHSLVQQEQAMRGSLDALRQGSLGQAAGPLLAAALAADAEASAGRRTGSLAGFSYAPTARSAHSRGARSASATRARPTSASPAFARTRPFSASPAGGVAGFSDGFAYQAAPPFTAGASAGRGPARGAGHYTTAGPVASGLVERREEELRGVLRQEIDKETERQAILAGTPDSKEAARLATIFQAERDAAKHRILVLSAAVHEAARTVEAMQLSPQLMPPGEKGQPASHSFLTPGATPSPARPRSAPRRPLGTEPLVPMQHGGGHKQGIVSFTGMRQVYTERRVALPDYTVAVPTPMEHPTMAHHHHMQHVVRSVPVA